MSIWLAVHGGIYAAGHYLGDKDGEVTSPRLMWAVSVTDKIVWVLLLLMIAMIGIGWKRLAAIIIIGCMTVLLFEGCLAYLLSYSRILQKINPLLAYEYYMTYDRKIIQFLPACAQYDPQLLYTLRPGTCRFKNREFDVEFQINRLGVRDDDRSLSAPDIVVLGDSHAMGWGVEQQQTFSQIIEHATGMTVLNTAISSYGTAREMMMLQRVNLEKLRYLIIQYNSTDYEENKAFYDHQNVLPISTETQYRNAVKSHADTVKYFWGKYTVTILPWAIASLKKQIIPQTSFQPGPTDHDEVTMFLTVLRQYSTNLKHVHLIVIKINGRGGNNRGFITMLNETLSQYRIPDQFKQITTLDLSSGLTPDKFFALDDHLSMQGHQYVADQIIQVIEHDRANLFRTR